MDFSHHALKSLADDTWINQCIEKMGESKFWNFKNKVYDLLDQLKVGESLKIDPSWNDANIEFYIKIAGYYISESNCCYFFNGSYTAIKRQFDNQKITAFLERTKNTTKNETLVESSN